MWMVKASAQRPELVQMLRGRLLAADVLLAGRQRQHEAAPASASTVSPQSRPGIWRSSFSRAANRPT